MFVADDELKTALGRAEDAERLLKDSIARTQLRDAEQRGRFAKGEPDIEAAVANLWGAIDEEGKLGPYPDLQNLEARIVGALKRLHAWPKDARRFGVKANEGA